MFAPRRKGLQVGTRLFGPRALRRISQICDPFGTRKVALASFFICQREIEMDVRVPRHRAGSAAKVLDRLIQVPLLLEDAAKIVTRDPAQRIELHCRGKLLTRFLGPTELIERYAKVNARIDPFRRERKDLAVAFHRLREKVRIGLAVECVLEKLLRAWAGERVDFGDPSGCFKGERPLLPQWIERPVGARRHDKNFAALFDEMQFLQGNGRGAELLLHQIDRSSDSPGRDLIVSEAFQGPERDEITETVEPFAPSRLWTNQPQPLPIAQTAQLDSQNAPNFFSSVSLRQTETAPCTLAIIMHPLSTACAKRCA